MIFLVKLHNVANFINQIVAGHKNSSSQTVFYHLYNYKTYLLNQEVVNLALEFWPAFCHFTPLPGQIY